MNERARPGDPVIDRASPVVSSAEVEIDAPIEAVWQVLTAIDQWPTWNPDVKSVSIDRPAAEGTTFRWRAGPGTITSTVVRFDRPRRIAWNGSTLGIRAIHGWHLEPRDDRTRVRTEESYSGLVARIFRRLLQKVLDRTLRDGVQSLKLAAERSVGSSARDPTVGRTG